MIDKTSLDILKILQDKARIPNAEIARQIGMAPSAVLERIRKLEKHGVIDGYEVRLNPKRFQRDLVAFISVWTSAPDHHMTIGRQLAALPETLEVHYTDGEDGYLIKLRVADHQELGNFIREKIGAIEQICRTQTRIVLTSLKETSRIPLPSEK